MGDTSSSSGESESLYRDRTEWRDVEPLPQNDGPNRKTNFRTHPTEFPEDLSSMYSTRSLCLLLLLWAVLVREGAGVISGPRSPRDRGQLEPRTVEAAEGKDPFELLEKGARLHKRQSSSNSSGIGTTAALSGDGHNQAVSYWVGYPSERIFIITRDRVTSGRTAYSRESWLWRSDDYGHHFENETYKLGDSDAVIQWYYISPMQNNLIFADTTNKRLYVTTDEGENYTRVDIPFVPDGLLFQSSLSPNVTEDFPLYVLGYDASNRTLWVSSDLGSTWTLLGENVTAGRYYWRVMNATTEGDLTTIYFETAINSTHAQLHYSVYPYSTHDVFDPSLEPFLINTFILTLEYMFVQMSASTGGDYQSPLWVSHYRKPFRQARFPLQTAERHYSVVDASEGQVFIAVYHSFNNTNLYLSEEQGLNYSLSLEYITSPPESDWVNGYPAFDVHVVEGIVGTYIANRKTPGSQYGATVISFDKGGIWTFLTPPAVTSGGAPIICLLPQCSLHLHMNSDRVYGYQSILSQDSAVGLIMAQGNLGAALQRYNYNIQRLYFSHDGGYTWQEVAQGFWQFQFAALGSIVVTVHMYQSGGVDNVRWSCDEGASWNETSFVDNSIRVVGMLTESGEKARHVTLFGRPPTGAFEWLVVDLNFSSVVPEQCTYPQDYYEWIPTERRGSRCLLGEVIIYERRKSEECCFVDPEYDKPTVRSTCECTIEDFECDFGFERVNLNSPCTPVPNLRYPPPPPTDCQEGGNYTYTSGYRRVAGDRCVPGNETYFLPVTRPCPIIAPKGLFLSHQPLIIFPGVNVTFDLTQLLGGRLATHYMWWFGDSSPVVDIEGYASGRSQVHMFQNPGTFTVNVTARNDGGTSQTLIIISVLDPITNVTIVLPGHYINGSIPSGIVLLYSSRVTTRFGTNNTTGIRYSWDFHDGFTSNSPTVEHAYSKAGTYQLTLMVQGNAGADAATTALHVYQVALAVNILSSDVVGTRFVHVGQHTTFTATPSSTSALIPSDTIFTWHVAGPGGVSSYMAHTKTLAYSFPQQGDYDISVVGNHSAGAFAAQRHLTAEVDISDVHVSVDSTVGVQELTHATLRVLSGQGQTYTGPLNITVHGAHRQLASHYFRNSLGGVQSVDLSLDTPGQVTVTFQAANDVSNVTENVNLLVVDMLAGVSFILPIQYYSISAIPTGVPLQFNSTLSTRHNTTIYGDVRYDWDFGDGHVLPNTSNAIVSHVYTRPGSLQLTLAAHGFSTTVRNIITLRVYQPVQSSSASIVGSDGVEGGRFVHVGRPISLTVQPTILSQEIPLDTNFTWKVVIVDTGISLPAVHNQTLSYSFPQQGDYNISVTGHHSVGNFANQTLLTAEIDITSLHVCTVPTVRTFVPTTANLTVLDYQGAGYTGLVSVSALDKNGTRLAGRHYSSIPGGEGHLDLELTQPGDIIVTLTAANDVSMATTEAHVVVVGDGQYGGLVLFLDVTPLLDRLSTSDWHAKLKDSIISYVNQTYGVSTLLVEVAFDNSYATPESHTVSIQSKRQSSDESSISVEVYILPATYTEEDFNSTMQISAAIVAEADGLQFTVDGDIVVVQNAFLLPLAHIVVVPALTPSPQNTKLYLGLGLGLGLGLIALVSFSTVMVIVTYYYRRKYSRLHVRYSRLQQGPVRFTVTDQKLETLQFSQLQEKVAMDS